MPEHRDSVTMAATPRQSPVSADAVSSDRCVISESDAAIIIRRGGQQKVDALWADAQIGDETWDQLHCGSAPTAAPPVWTRGAAACCLNSPAPTHAPEIHGQVAGSPSWQTTPSDGDRHTVGGAQASTRAPTPCHRHTEQRNACSDALFGSVSTRMSICVRNPCWPSRTRHTSWDLAV
jgi:hypothetical protein